MYQQVFNIHKFCILPTMYSRVLMEWRKTAIISLYSIKLSVFITEAQCLLRSTDWVFNCDRSS